MIPQGKQPRRKETRNSDIHTLPDDDPFEDDPLERYWDEDEDRYLVSLKEDAPEFGLAIGDCVSAVKGEILGCGDFVLFSVASKRATGCGMGYLQFTEGGRLYVETRDGKIYGVIPRTAAKVDVVIVQIDGEKVPVFINDRGVA